MWRTLISLSAVPLAARMRSAFRRGLFLSFAIFFAGLATVMGLAAAFIALEPVIGASLAALALCGVLTIASLAFALLASRKRIGQGSAAVSHSSEATRATSGPHMMNILAVAFLAGLSAGRRS